ncbi:uncharacterized protein si:ch211-281l24.3 isoform X8 [Labeo rohita]|uniref:uncharacterized protein si:ch211-281l24.3 isoform X8 n=1 Tax=Labeo rohita TaxID=84645 RepID=UPI0021E249AB|nr:uncharacterized protein si:ch211-281l24.3 isoform X8 [Labeo rohita]
MDTQDSEEDVGTMKCERLRPDKETSPSPSVTTLQSDQSLDLQVLFKDGSQSFLGIKRSRQGQSTSPAPSVTSLQSDQSLDRPILFKDGAQSKKRRKSQRLRPDKGTSPAPSCTSLQSNESMDRPILFKDRTQSKERLRPDKGTSPAPSCTSLQSNESMDRPILFKDGTQSKERLRPDKGTSPAPSCTSLQSNESMDRPILFKDRTQSKKRLRPDKGTSPAPSCTSLQSNESMDRPILFKDGTQSIERLRPDKGTSPAPSCTSLQSNESMDRPILFKDGTQSKERLRPDKGTSPAPSCTSLQSNESMDRPILFKDGTQSSESIPEKNAEEPFDRHISFRNDTLSPDISTLSVTLLTEDHYRCSVCTEVLKDPVSIPCGHSYCKHCIESYWSKPTYGESYACPQCRKSFSSPPVLNVNVALAKVIKELLQAGFSPALPAHCYAGPKDVPCDICTEMKLKAVKTCLTCTASYCETHIRQHYSVPALQRHNLVEAIHLPDKEERKSPDEFGELTARVTELEATSKRLCKRFEIHCNDFPSDVIEMAALGHPLSLGMLYDSQKKSFCQGIFMWDEDTLARMKVSLPRPQTYVKVLENDSLQERFRVLEMSPVLQGVQTGQIKVSGASAFLNHPEQSQHQERATLHYRTTTRLDMLSQRLLQEAVPSALVGQTTATHVIIAVFFGAQAFFVFDGDRSNHEKNAAIVDVLKIMTSTFCPNHIISNLSATEKAKSSLLACSLYIDVGDWKSPVSFDKAVEVYGSLPTLLGSKDEQAVPLKVWLYPLKKLNKISMCAALSGVSENLIQRAESIMEHLRKQIRICQDIIKDYIHVNVIMQSQTLEDKLVGFLELLQEYQTTFQKGITDIVHIKEGKREKSLQDLLKRHSQSPFSAEKTDQWLENKETELKILNDFRAANITVVKSQAELQQIISHSQKTRVMCLTLYSPDVEDYFLTALRQYIESDHVIQNDSLQFRPVSISDKEIIKVQMFIAANEDAEQTKFIAALVTSDDFPEYSVQFYRDGRIASRNVTLGTKSGLVQISNIKHTSVSLKLNQPEPKRIERYVVEYRALGDDGSNSNTWKQIVFDAKIITETCMISDLKPGHQYQLRYIFVEQDCMNFSRIGNFTTVVAATPGKPLVNKLDRDTLKVTWLRAETDQDFPVLRYNVEYKEAGLEGWPSVQTEGPECECTLTVLHSTCYRVRVSAVYEDITSQPSEETPVPVDVWNINLSKRKSSILLEVLKLQTEKKPVELIDWTDEESEVKGYLQCLPYISQLRFDRFVYYKKQSSFQLLVNLAFAASKFKTAEENYTEMFTSVCSYTSFPFSENYPKHQCDFLLDLYSHVKEYGIQTGRSVLPALQPIYQSAPAVWIVKLSERKSSILLEVLKLQTEKKPVELIDWTDEESEVKGFLQCLPYISQLRFDRFVYYKKQSSFQLLVNLAFAASKFKTAEENYTEMFTSVCSYTSFPFSENYPKHQCDFLLDLYSHVKEYGIQTGRSVLPALQPIYQSAPAVWIVKLSERKSSILLEVLKLQTEKKPVELIDWTDEENMLRGFFQCLPYISQLRFPNQQKVSSSETEIKKRLLALNLSFQVPYLPKEIIEASMETLFSYMYYGIWDFLLDLYSHVKDYEIQTGRSVLPAFHPVYQSAPAVWSIKLLERKSSILLEVLKLQTEKKPVELIDWTDEESEVKGFLQCLPYISQLRFNVCSFNDEKQKSAVQFLVNLSVAASECDEATGESFTALLIFVCSYKSFPCENNGCNNCDHGYVECQIKHCDFLLDLYSQMKNYKIQTGRSVLPVLQVIYQSAPAVWRIKLSERKSSILLEVLKLQTEKKPVELIDWTDEESEVKGFLQCLPYISQLRFRTHMKREPAVKFLLNLIVSASEFKENCTELLTSVCSYTFFPYNEGYYSQAQCDFLLDLCSHVKDYETQTGRSVLPALQPIYQSALTVWIIDLSERKSSILLEVLKLQTEKKPVELIDWTDEESEVKGFLQCLPYISQLRFDIDNFEREPAVKLLLKLIVSASEFDAIKGENYTELLTSVCSYTSFPFNEDYFDDSEYQIDQCNFLLDLCSHMKNYETRTDRSVLPALQPIYQSAPAVWIIDLSERKSSILLEVLKLQTEKKPVKLIDWTDEESEVKGFLQCLPYISQLRIHESDFSYESAAQFLLNLTVAASKCVTTTGENFIELLTSVCSYKSFLCYDDDDIYDDCQNEHCDFLLDLCSHVKDYETQTGSSVLPALQPIYQSAPAVWRIKLSERKSSILLEVLKLQTEKKPVELIDWTDEESEVKGFLQCLPYISQLRFVIDNFEREPAVKFLLKLIVSASEFDAIKGESYTELLTSVCSYTFFPNIECNYYNKNHQINQSDFLLDLYSHVKDYDSQTGRSVLPALQPIYQSAPAVWRIKLSERKSSILLEVLKLQTEKKPVVLIDWTDDESEVKGFLQCLPYISQLRFNLYALSHFERKSSVQFLANLVISALEFDKDTSENYTELLTSVCSYTSFPCSENYTNHQCNFLLDLYSHVKDYETQTGRSVLPALQPIYQSAPAVWSINLSERKSSILLEVLKLQTEKKPVELIDWTDEESEVKGFLQCLPYISQLRFDSLVFKKKKRSVQFLGNLIISASEFHKTTGENYTELFTSMCSYTSFPCSENNTNYHTDQCDFLLDLYSHVKDYESQTGRSVLPALQPIYQSAPAVWRIKLSERKSSILLEVLKLQTEKKPVVLIDWTDDESEVKGFLQCLPYISQLRFNLYALSHFERKSSVQFLANLVISALEFDKDTSENYTELLTSVCSYTSFPCSENYTNHQCNFLLDLYSHVKDYETQTGRSVLPALQPIYQSAPAVWSINLSERKSSILLEVLKLQTEKKPVELIDWTDEESEVKGFLQCLPYISQLRFDSLVFKKKKRSVQFLRNLIISASEFDKTTGENNTELFTSMCSYTSFPCSENNTNCHTDQCDFLLDLYSHVKDYESQTGRSVLPALQPIYQSAPAVWIIKLSERKSSILLEVLKLQTEKKPVELIDWTDEESKVKGFLQCLPYISQLRPSKEALQQLVSVVYDAQDDELTDCFLKVSEDLTSCSLTWDVIHYLLQHQALNLKVDFRKSKISCENIRKLLPLLDRIQLKRLSPSFTLSIILEIYETRFPQYVSSLMSSAGNDINLNGRVLDYVHCAALRFILEHCDTVKLNLLWTSIAEGELESFLPLLSKVKQLSVDRLLLLKLLHCCSSSDLQQEAADVLLSALQNRLDFSCCSALDLTDTQENQEHFQTN